MSTNSTVSKLNANGTVTSIYGHWDGGLWKEGVGDMLINHYNSEERVDALLALGDFSSLNPILEAPEGHSFDTPTPEVTVFYGRDRGEYGTEAHTTDAGIGWQKYWQEYNYIWKDGQWFYFTDDNHTMRPLTKEVIGS